MANFWEKAAHSVDHMFSGILTSCNITICILVISRFGFEGWSLVLIASVPDLCILFTSDKRGFLFLLVLGIGCIILL